MIEKSTNELDEMLGEIKPGELSVFLKENSKYMADDSKAFYYYFKDVIDSKNIFLKDIYLYAGVSESYGAQIVRMEKHTKDRDLIIRLCVAAHFTLEEINRALKLYGMAPLYPKDKRDVCIITAIHNRIFNILKIDEILENQGMKILSE